MTESDYTVGNCRPPVHSRFQKGQSGNPGGRPGPAKQLKQRFSRALREALEKNSEQLVAARPTDMLSAVARQLTLDATAGRTAAQRLLLSLIDNDAGRPQDSSDQLTESEPAAAPAFEEGRPPVLTSEKWDALFSLLQGEFQGGENERAQEMLKILAENATPPKEQGENREVADVAVAGETP